MRLTGDEQEEPEAATCRHPARPCRRIFPNSIHIVTPGGHVAGSPCVDRNAARLYETGSVAGLDTNCVAAERLPPFALPARR